jgi:hypothetical protein
LEGLRVGGRVALQIEDIYELADAGAQDEGPTVKVGPEGIPEQSFEV